MHIVVGLGIRVRRPFTLLPQRIAGGRIHTHPGGHIELVLALSNLPNLLGVTHVDVVITCQIQNLVCIVGEVECNIPSEILSLDRNGIQGKFKALIPNLCQVHHHTADTMGCR